MPSTSTTRKPARKQSHRVPDSPIPDKLYFRIGEVAQLCAVQAYVLRFWESEFSVLRPNKSGTGQRLYRRRDVETALRIRHLLYQEGYTIAGARQALKQESKHPTAPIAAEDLKQRQQQDQRPLQFAATPRPPADIQIDRLRQDLRALLLQLSAPPSTAVRSINAHSRNARSINSGSRDGTRTRRNPNSPDTGLF